MTVDKGIAGGRLYAIVDLGYVSPEAIAGTAEQLCVGGADVIQLRAKGFDPDAILTMARLVAPACREHGVPFIVNDYPEIAAAAGADGVHIGQGDGNVDEARERAGGCRIVGRSTHSLQQAVAAGAEGADYIGFGPLHATATKPGRPPIGLDDIAEAHRLLSIPIYCIGGITLRNLADVTAAGAKNVVIVSDLLQTEDIPSYVARVKRALAAPKDP